MRIKCNAIEHGRARLRNESKNGKRKQQTFAANVRKLGSYVFQEGKGECNELYTSNKKAFSFVPLGARRRYGELGEGGTCSY